MASSALTDNAHFPKSRVTASLHSHNSLITPPHARSTCSSVYDACAFKHCEYASILGAHVLLTAARCGTAWSAHAARASEWGRQIWGQSAFWFFCTHWKSVFRSVSNSAEGQDTVKMIGPVDLADC
jgi:hypothetical protein